MIDSRHNLFFNVQIEQIETMIIKQDLRQMALLQGVATHFDLTA